MTETRMVLLAAVGLAFFPSESRAQAPRKPNLVFFLIDDLGHRDIGGSTCDVPVMSLDFYPTLAEAAGARLAEDHAVDGVSLLPLLQGGQTRPCEALYWHYPHYSNQGGFPGGAIRVGDWKLIERYEDGRTHLYNLRDDEAERHDLAADQPDRVRDLRTRLHAWYRQVDAQFLEPKPGGPQLWRP